MASSARPPIPGTPRVISPSPTPSEFSAASGDDYFESGKRHAVRRSARLSAANQLSDTSPTSPSAEANLDDLRARSRSREDDPRLRRRRPSTLAAVAEDDAFPPTVSARARTHPKHTSPNSPPPTAANANGHLSPSSAAPKSYWRDLSRSPSPLGLIPIHREWRSFVHRHEIPRKALHVSIGFLTLGLYASGYQTSRIHPVLLSMLVPIALVDVLRHNWPWFNGVYIRVMGAFMRESEAHDRYNGVIWYLVGTWAVMRFLPKDVAVLSVLLLSWCDTAASTCGRAWGRYTPAIRRGKSLAGSAAAFVVGVGAALFWWGWFAPRYESLGWADNTGENAFAFQGRLALPGASVGGGVALGIMSLWAGFVASASEAVDVYSFDDNVTIPILAGAGLWGFLKLFGVA